MLHFEVLILCKNRFRVLHDSAQEQLADAYARAISAQSLDDKERLSILQSVSSTNPPVFVSQTPMLKMFHFYLLSPAKAAHNHAIRDNQLPHCRLSYSVHRVSQKNSSYQVYQANDLF